MEDALISPAGFSILSGAGLIESSTLRVHTTERTNKVAVSGNNSVKIYIKERPYQPTVNSEVSSEHIYVMRLAGDEVVTEPYIPQNAEATLQTTGDYKGLYELSLKTTDNLTNVFSTGCTVLVDYYSLGVDDTSDPENIVKATGKHGSQIDITPDKFGGNYYLEASTLFRDTNGVDLPAEFIIPNCKIQSNFTFSMASSGDPSTFTFTMDAFPDYTRWDPTKKVLASIQILDVTSDASTRSRTVTPWTETAGGQDATREKTWTGFEPAND